MLVHPEAAMADAFSSRFEGLPNVRILEGMFEDLPPHDCFVTAGNSMGIMTAGIDAAVVRFHGQELMDAIQLRIMDEYLGEQPVGTCFLQPTSRADYPYVAHAPTMRVPGSVAGRDNVYSATWAALLAIYWHNSEASEDKKITTVAFPAMGTGFGGVRFDEAARQMAVAYTHYLSPPHRLDWVSMTERHKVLSYVDGQQVVR
jgi:O-acetyl-ADP-ribose deacetylase (regulator of RNase III)